MRELVGRVADAMIEEGLGAGESLYEHEALELAKRAIETVAAYLDDLGRNNTLPVNFAAGMLKCAISEQEDQTTL